ncbi:AAA family ATPase [Candidatus Berkiella aquae]|uniref:ATP-binding protein n=1 Tax=Candidatus Berkiella aquae TaxID=295108 RepID=A0A0Q9YTA0_9GAMM|nr:ATP-binding protein [Candidatus Berkiella aquae]MCS5712908.1 ATP-binding protein [Candidatus Berkiella aquae]
MQSNKPTLYLICGLPGAGKTTFAKMLEIEKNALRLTPDEWMSRIVGDGYDEAKRAVVEQIQWEIAARVLSLGVNAILDYGFWGRSERDDYRARAKAHGARTKVCFLDVSREELLKRLSERNASLPEDTFKVDEAQLDLWSSWFQKPTQDELDDSD